MRRRTWMIFLTGICLFFSGCGAGKDMEETEELLAPVGAVTETVQVLRKDLMDADYENGYVTPFTYELSFEIDGTVSYCQVRPGDAVEQYQELATLDDEELSEGLLALEEEYERAERRFQLQNQQWEQEMADLQERISGLASDTEEYELLQLELEEQIFYHAQVLEEQEQALAELDAQYEEMNQDTTKNHLLSPCSGIVVRVDVQPGQEIFADTCVMVVADFNNAYISCDTFHYQSQIDQLASLSGYLGDQVFDVEYIPYTDEELREAAQMGDVSSLNGRYRLDLEKTGARIGDSAVVEMVNRVAEDVLCVSKRAIYTDTSGSYVYRLEEGIRRRVDVEIGLDNGMEVEILAGDLQEGDEVYVPE